MLLLLPRAQGPGRLMELGAAVQPKASEHSPMYALRTLDLNGLVVVPSAGVEVVRVEPTPRHSCRSAVA